MLSDFLSATITIALSTHGSITSWMRSPKRNAEVGGVPNSLHLVALAVDIVHDDPEDKARAVALAERLGLFVIDEGDHIHLQPRNDPRR